ncbi:MAG: hypothetical protein ACE5OR_03565 [bacterium]
MRAIVLICITIVIGLVLVFSVSLSVGWILTLLLPFSLFEGTLLAMIATVSTLVIWQNMLRSAPTQVFEEESDFGPDEIPPSMFWDRKADRTWENWFRYVLANSIYEDFFISPHWVEAMNGEQLQEMSIRLADAGVEVLKKKSPYAKRLRVSRGALRHEMGEGGQEPYDDDILAMAATSINAEVRVYGKELREVAREQLWEAPADVF